MLKELKIAPERYREVEAKEVVAKTDKIKKLGIQIKSII